MLRTAPLVTLLVAACTGPQTTSSSPTSSAVDDDAISQEVSSSVIETAAGELVLVQTISLRAPLSRVWSAYTTSEGWRGWVAPVAAVDFRVGGTVRSHYTEGATLGDPGTITIKIVNYAPKRFLTLQAELAENFPDFIKANATNLFNVIVFEAIDATATKVSSYGVGYLNNPKYRTLLDYFVGANEKTLMALRTYVESAPRTVD